MIPLSKMYFVGFPITNTAIASAFIRDNYLAAMMAVHSHPPVRSEVPSGIVNVAHIASPYTPRGLRNFIHVFMWRYPRGKGTKGSPLLREMYAACRTIKVAQSKPKGWNSRARYAHAALSLTKTQQSALAKFTDPLKVLTRSGGDISGRSAPLEKLSDLGMIGVAYDDRLVIVEAWLTDYGIEVSKAARTAVTHLRPYMAKGSEILALETIDGVEKHVHFATARDESSAETIALALNR
jgi:hypothetical protein